MTKNPSSEFYTSNSESQVLGSIDPLLVISEPPDIKNWFSSYKYESPELNTGESLDFYNNLTVNDSEEDVSYVEDSIKEKDEDLGVISEIKNGDDFRGSGEIAGSGFSEEEETYVEDTFKDKKENLGVIGEFENGDEFERCGGLKGSESYEDMSFVEDSITEKYEDVGVIGDTNVTDFGKCDGPKGDDCNKEDSYVEDSIKQNDCEIVDYDKVASKGFLRCENFVGHNDPNQAVDMSDTLGFSSEPPDIKNWFSSYVYESPVLDTNDEFGLSTYKERKTSQAGVHNGMHIKTKEVDAMKNSSSDEVNNDDHQNRGQSEDVGGKVLCVVTDLSLKGVFQQVSESNRAPNREDTDISKLFDRDSTRKPKRKLPQNDLHTSSEINPSSVNKEKSPKKLMDASKFTEKSSDAKPAVSNAVSLVSPRDNLYFISSNRSSLTRTETSSNKENDKNDCADNGFISARKNKCRKENNENSVSKPLGAYLGSNIQVSTGSNKVDRLSRKVLTDTTNTQPCDVLGVAGKWRCPQKSKPNLGPPMKQLGLERWVHRI